VEVLPVEVGADDRLDSARERLWLTSSPSSRNSRPPVSVERLSPTALGKCVIG
jgi:hypothetical protein